MSVLKIFSTACTANLSDYDSLMALIAEILGNELPRRPLWLEKKRWQGKISAFPEIKALWAKILDSSVKPQQAQRLFCFNLLRLCDPLQNHTARIQTDTQKFMEQR